MRRRTNERNVCFPPALREQIQREWKARGYRSEQQFILDACRHELERNQRNGNGGLEQRLASSIGRLLSEIRETRRDVNASHAFQSAFVKYSLTCQVEPTPARLPEARSRARERYQQMIDNAGLEMRESGFLREVADGGKVAAAAKEQPEENEP